jgi:hypothetical protein
VNHFASLSACSSKVSMRFRISSDVLHTTSNMAKMSNRKDIPKPPFAGKLKKDKKYQANGITSWR